MGEMAWADAFAAARASPETCSLDLRFQEQWLMANVVFRLLGQ
jgi:hypothetical protein